MAKKQNNKAILMKKKNTAISFPLQLKTEIMNEQKVRGSILTRGHIITSKSFHLNRYMNNE